MSNAYSGRGGGGYSAPTVPTGAYAPSAPSAPSAPPTDANHSPYSGGIPPCEILFVVIFVGMRWDGFWCNFVYKLRGGSWPFKLEGGRGGMHVDME